jgi:membrane dipeptidase
MKDEAAAYSDYEPWLEQAKDLHRRIPVFMGYLDFTPEQFQPTGGIQCDTEKMDAAGVREVAVSIGYGCYFATGQKEYVIAGSDEWLLERQLGRIDWVLDTLRKNPRARLVTRASDLARKPGDDSIGVILHLTGNNHTVSLGVVDTFFHRGVRATHPAMPYHNRWCRAMGGMPSPVLNEYGRQVIGRMNELGIALDTAHASDESAQAIIRASTKPCIDSHTTSRNLVPSSRGLLDETLRMLADRGGVAGIHFADHLVTEEANKHKYDRAERKERRPDPLWEYNKHVLATIHDPDERVKMRKNREAIERFYREKGITLAPAVPTARVATLKHMGDMVNYLVNLMGIGHVAIGGDVNGITPDSWPVGMDNVGELPHLTAELLRRGYKEDALEKFLSANWRRVYAACLPA